MRFSSAVEQPFQPSTNSSMVEQLTLNQLVEGSSPSWCKSICDVWFAGYLRRAQRRK